MSDEILFCDFDFVDFVDDHLAGSGIIYGCKFCQRQKKVYGDRCPPNDVVCLNQEEDEVGRELK